MRLGGRLAAAGHAQLAEDVGHVDAGRLGRDEQLAGDFPVAAPGRDQAEHLEFALGQPEPEPKPELARASAVGTSKATVGLPKNCSQSSVLWLSQPR